MVQLVNHGLVFVLLVCGSFTTSYTTRLILSLQTVVSGPDLTFGLALVYILASLYHGSSFNVLWHSTFYWTAAVITAIITLDYALHNFQDLDDSDQEGYGEPDLMKDFSLSRGESQKQISMPLQIPDYFAGVMDLPLPLSTLGQGEPCAGLFAGGTDSYRSIHFMGSPEKHDREPFVSPDYFSYAFHA